MFYIKTKKNNLTIGDICLALTLGNSTCEIWTKTTKVDVMLLLEFNKITQFCECDENKDG